MVFSVVRKILFVIALMAVASILFFTNAHHASAEGCTASDQRNCIYNTWTILAPNMHTIWQVKQAPVTIDSSNYAKYFDVTCNWFTGDCAAKLKGISYAIPSFETKKCPARGEWTAQVDVERKYIDGNGNPKTQKSDPSPQYANVFNCKDWVGPQITPAGEMNGIGDAKIDYKTGYRTITINISDNESFGAQGGYLNDSQPDNTILRSCYYNIHQSTDSLNPTLSTNYKTGGWVNIPECNNKMTVQDYKIAVSPSDCMGSCTVTVVAFDTSDVNKVNGAYKGNIGVQPFPLPPVFTAINNKGYCPRGPKYSRCYVGGLGTADNFSKLFPGHTYDEKNVPICVQKSDFVNDLYCNSNLGIVPRSEGLFKLAKEYASTSNFYEYCAPYNRIAGISGDSLTALPYNATVAEKGLMQACVLNDISSGAKLVAIAINKQNLDTSYNFANLTGSTDFVFSPGNSGCSDTNGVYTCNNPYINSTLNVNNGLFLKGAGFSPALKNYDDSYKSVSDTDNMISALYSEMKNGYSDFLKTGSRATNLNLQRDFSGLDKNTSYHVIAYETNNGKSALGLAARINPGASRGNYLVGAYYKGFTQSQETSLCNYAKSIGTPSPSLNNASIYCNQVSGGLIIIAQPYTQNLNTAAASVERLVARLRI